MADKAGDPASSVVLSLKDFIFYLRDVKTTNWQTQGFRQRSLCLFLNSATELAEN